MRFGVSASAPAASTSNLCASSTLAGAERSKLERSFTEPTPVACITISRVSGTASLGSFCNPAMTAAAMAMLTHTASYH
ncbi:hypothetical protein KC19_3G163300 [Ceratodon purpureus]|uniref:Uncharacterized protein n=1 Tax=Ceratodon purpureus TaxID=3225 RepID=A0A8T0IJ51_CERPU|nr:hypothetical protein KC19_3G163300 [Ceratodon purpureus]